MMLTNPTHDFFARAAISAKEVRLHDFNMLEAELIMLEETLIKIRESITQTIFNAYNDRIYELQALIKEKKKEYLE
jgi:hypothetical protein